MTPKPIPSAKLLIVDDEAAQMRALRDTLEDEGYLITATVSANQALEILREEHFDLVLTDLMMPEMDGIVFLSKALEIDGNLAGLVMTGHGTIGTAVAAMKMGALDYILKPFTLSDIRRTLERSLASRRLRMENIQLRETVAISELSLTVSSTRDCDQVLQKVVEAASRLNNSGHVLVLLPNADGTELSVVAGNDAGGEQTSGSRLVTTEPLAAWVSRTRELLSRADSIGDIEMQFAPPAAIGTGGVAVPMVSGGTLVGILAVVPKGTKRGMSTGQLRALDILASSGASAFESALRLEKLRLAEERYRLLAENAPDIIYRYELHPRRGYTFVNPQISAVSGYTSEEYYSDPGLGLKIVHPEDRAALESILRGEATDSRMSTMRWVHKNGSLVWIEQHHSLVRDQSERPTAVECIARDITERRRLEEQLRQSQKMEAVGRLAGGIAHDFNNLLTVINGYSSQLLELLHSSDPLHSEIAEIAKAGERAASLTRQLLAFSRQQVVTPQALNINTIVADMDRMLRRMITENIEISTVLEPALDTVRADRGQIEQVIMNLTINARDAMPQGGRLTIETANVELDSTYARKHNAVTPGHYVLLAVSDTGIGMDSATQARIFEPFFTTKTEGKGTGLGLSTVHGIVRQNNGDIWVYSEVGRGTTFKVYLPRVAERPGLVGTTASIAVSGSETVLIVEDEDGVRKLIRSVLSRAGYTVLEARNHLEAVEFCEKHQGLIHMTIADMVMPGLAGPELAELIVSLRPGIKVLFMSGYTNHSMVRNGALGSEMPFLQKPFTPSVLAAKVRDVLDSVPK